MNSMNFAMKEESNEGNLQLVHLSRMTLQKEEIDPLWIVQEH